MSALQGDLKRNETFLTLTLRNHADAAMKNEFVLILSKGNKNVLNLVFFLKKNKNKTKQNK